VRISEGELEIPPNERIVYLTTFSVYAFVGLVVLEVVHMLYFGVWNSEIFSAITGLIGTVSGVLIGSHA
jgi:hypothetical protein